MERWKFGVDNERLIKLVLCRKKTATCSIYDGTPSIIGETSMLLNDNGEEVCKLQTIEVRLLMFKDITWDLAVLEGEFETLQEWRDNHYEFFKQEDDNFNEESIIELYVSDTEPPMFKQLYDAWSDNYYDMQLTSYLFVESGVELDLTTIFIAKDNSGKANVSFIVEKGASEEITLTDGKIFIPSKEECDYYYVQATASDDNGNYLFACYNDKNCDNILNQILTLGTIKEFKKKIKNKHDRKY